MSENTAKKCFYLEIACFISVKKNNIKNILLQYKTNAHTWYFCLINITF